MRNYILLILFTTTITSCKKDLTGHWHAELINHPYKTSFTSSFDIEKNNVCYYTSSLLYQPIKGKHLPKEKNIWLYYGGCGSGNFDYFVKGNTLHLKNYLGDKLEAKKVICNRICDYQTKLNIDFLKLKRLTNDSLYNKDLNEYINIGFSKKDSSLMLETNASDKLETIKSLDSLAHKREPHYQDEVIPYINYVLTPDKNIKANVFKNILKRLEKTGKKEIYIRTLKDSLTTNNRNIFEYIRIKEGQFDFDSEKKLSEIIN